MRNIKVFTFAVSDVKLRIAFDWKTNLPEYKQYFLVNSNSYGMQFLQVIYSQGN